MSEAALCLWISYLLTNRDIILILYFGVAFVIVLKVSENNIILILYFAVTFVIVLKVSKSNIILILYFNDKFR